MSTHSIQPFRSLQGLGRHSQHRSNMTNNHTLPAQGAKPADEVQSYLLRDHLGNIGGKLHFNASYYLREMLTYAIGAYGFLIGRNERLSPAQFIERIRSTYECEGEPRNKAVVDALSQLV